jgi:hypothetical protein
MTDYQELPGDLESQFSAIDAIDDDIGMDDGDCPDGS